MFNFIVFLLFVSIDSGVTSEIQEIWYVFRENLDDFVFCKFFEVDSASFIAWFVFNKLKNHPFLRTRLFAKISANRMFFKFFAKMSCHVFLHLRRTVFFSFFHLRVRMDVVRFKKIFDKHRVLTWLVLFHILTMVMIKTLPQCSVVLLIDECTLINP